MRPASLDEYAGQEHILAPGKLLRRAIEADRISSIILFSETSAFGLRLEKVARLKLERRFETVATEFGEVTVKLGLKQGRVVQVAPEFESCRAASERTGQPLRAIYAAASRACEARVAAG